jgi:hypothetical protein
MPLYSCTLIDLSDRQWKASCAAAAAADTASQSCSNKAPVDQLDNPLLAICARLAPRLIDYDFALLELNCRTGTPKRHLDQAFEQLADGVCNNGMVIYVLSAGRGKDGQAIMYHRIHRKKQHHVDNNADDIAGQSIATME